MKNIIKSLLAITAVASIGSASAETIYISGSTAFRSKANTAIKNYCEGTPGGGIIAANNATFTDADKYVGKFTVDGITNFISVAFAGSEGGIASAAGPRGANGVNVTFWGTNASGTSEGTVVSTPADLAFSDTFQGTSIFNGKVGGKAYSQLTGWDDANGEVGVVTFCWVASKNCPISNVTSMQAQAILSAGVLPVAVFTGNSADETKAVYLLGRNADSGTRLATFGESGYGANALPTQYMFNSPTSIQLYPREEINGTVYADGDSGYSSGSSICSAMVNILGAGADLLVDGVGSTYAENYLIGYSGISDANKRTSEGLKKLTYNGVESTTTNIQNGSYSYWTYIHFYGNPSASPLAKTVLGDIGSTLAGETTTALTPNVGLSNMRVARNGDGTDIQASAY